ncbi:MAG: DUF2007 domain-containing protein [Pseudomonadota bacterium]|nr:DUF2007 domain-containing protein [Pseudomonadota bacterium]
MKELLRSLDLVHIGFVQALLKDAGIKSHIFDANMSIVGGSIGAIPRRLTVEDADYDRALALLDQAGL